MKSGRDLDVEGKRVEGQWLQRAWRFSYSGISALLPGAPAEGPRSADSASDSPLPATGHAVRWHPAGHSTIEGAVVALLCVGLLGIMWWNEIRPLVSLAPHSA
jgi:hypothetical protein